jgi:hypothetical protein
VFLPLAVHGCQGCRTHERRCHRAGGTAQAALDAGLEADPCRGPPTAGGRPSTPFCRGWPGRVAGQISLAGFAAFHLYSQPSCIRYGRSAGISARALAGRAAMPAIRLPLRIGSRRTVTEPFASSSGSIFGPPGMRGRGKASSPKPGQAHEAFQAVDDGPAGSAGTVVAGMAVGGNQGLSTGLAGPQGFQGIKHSGTGVKSAIKLRI